MSDESAALLAPMLQRRLFVSLSEPGPGKDFSHVMPLLAEHLKYLIELEQTGVLFGSGPFLEDGEIGLRGLCIVRAASLEEARSIVEQDPLHMHDVRRFTLEEWMLNEGRVTVSVDFSNQGGLLDNQPRRVSKS